LGGEKDTVLQGRGGKSVGDAWRQWPNGGVEEEKTKIKNTKKMKQQNFEDNDNRVLKDGK